MGVISRGIIFFAGTISNAIIFIFMTRIILPIINMGQNIAGTGPASGALQLLPTVMMLTIGIFELGLIMYFIGGLGQEKTAVRRPL